MEGTPALVLWNMTFEQLFLIAFMALSFLVALLRHPGIDRTDAIAKVVQTMGMFSLLRFKNSPGTLHLPFRRQPPPVPSPAPPQEPAPAQRSEDTLPQLSAPHVVALLVSLALVSGCLTAAKIRDGMRQLDRYAANAEGAYLACLKDAGIETPPTLEALVPDACRLLRRCLVQTNDASRTGAQAVRDGAEQDPWLSGQAATSWKQLAPTAARACIDAGVDDVRKAPQP